MRLVSRGRAIFTATLHLPAKTLPPRLLLAAALALLGPVAACATRGVPLDVPIVRDIDIRGESVLSESGDQGKDPDRRGPMVALQ